MTGFLSKWQGQSTLSTPHRADKAKLAFRDPDDLRILYKFSSRARRIALRVNAAEREIIVTVPGERALNKAKQFVRAQKDWINVQLETLPMAQPFTPGASILFRGETYQLTCPGARGRATIDTQNRVISVPALDETFEGRVLRLLKREARHTLETSSEFYAQKLGREIGKISIRDTRSRWGSCITRQGLGHISYSWRLIAAPPFVLDYVAAHECAHMIEPNHSAAFWAVVDDIFDETKAAKAWLRQYGGRLHAVGARY